MSIVLVVTHENGTRGRLTAPDARFDARGVPCALGRSGVVEVKAEGDGATPLGRYRMRSCYWRPDRGPRPVTGLPTMPIGRDLGWCDDPDHPLYNRPVRLPFPGRHEAMWREDRAYDLVVVLDQNVDPALPGRGSAVFWHLTKSDETLGHTEGCVAVAPPVTRELLRRCDAQSVMVIEGATNRAPPCEERAP